MEWLGLLVVLVPLFWLCWLGYIRGTTSPDEYNQFTGFWGREERIVAVGWMLFLGAIVVLGILGTALAR